MKVAVSLPDEVFAAAERMVKESGRSRSEVYATAVREYVARHTADTVTAALDHVVDGLPDEASYRRFSDRAARRTLASSEW